jgi:hypothetical protein
MINGENLFCECIDFIAIRYVLETSTYEIYGFDV